MNTDFVRGLELLRTAEASRMLAQKTATKARLLSELDQMERKRPPVEGSISTVEARDRVFLQLEECKRLVELCHGALSREARACMTFATTLEVLQGRRSEQGPLTQELDRYGQLSNADYELQTQARAWALAADLSVFRDNLSHIGKRRDAPAPDKIGAVNNLVDFAYLELQCLLDGHVNKEPQHGA